jgi:hypothetical protein
MENGEGNGEKEIEEQKEGQLAPNKDLEKPDLEPIFDGVEKLADDHGINEFVFAFIKDGVAQPLVFWKNPNNDHHFDATSLLASVMRDLKGRIVQELDC